jgi:glycosyltransferase involved in cell wall biosynthesis
MLNIALLHYAAPPIVGGVETILAQHAGLMTENGHRVRIIAGRGAQFDERIAFSAVPEVDSRHPEVLALKEQLDAGKIPDGFEDLVNRIASAIWGVIEPTDLVIAHNVCSLNKNLALTAALHRISEQHRRPRFILWHHDLAWTTPRYRGELHDGYPWDLLRTDWPWADQVVVSEQRRRELSNLIGVPEGRICVIPNGVNVGEFLQLGAETEGLRRRLDLSLAAPLLLLPVRITPRKNIELALRVLRELRQKLENAQLIVTGPLGPHNPSNLQYFEGLLSLRAELGMEPSAHFLAEEVDHSIPNEVVADLYRLADILFLPSREEGFGIPLLEAGLARTPIFCSDIEALRELGEAQVNYFSPDGDPAKIAAQITRGLNESREYGLRKRILREHAWEQVYRAHIAPLLEKGRSQ